MIVDGRTKKLRVERGDALCPELVRGKSLVGISGMH